MILNPKEFILKDIPNYHPLSSDYIRFWRTSKKRCIEGYWLGGYWMPPNLYFYANFGIIRRNKVDSKAKHFGRPDLRDIEWEFFYNYTISRGFSGFKNDNYFSCNKDILNLPPNLLSLSCRRPDGQPKGYIPAHEYIRQRHDPSVESQALYENECYNMMMMGSRNIGKSYLVGVGLVLYTFIFDGLTEYNEQTIANLSPVEMIVGANESRFSTEILKKTREGLDNLPGKFMENYKVTPAPFTKRYSGSWEPGKEVRAEYKKKYKGGWDTAGSRSSIKNMTFKDNTFAAAGTRPLIMVLEECGLFDNLKDVFNNTVDNFKDDYGKKTGTLMMLGTGAEMTGGTIDASEMFYEPEKYYIYPHNDIWESKGTIAYFVPAYLGLSGFKDPNTGYTDIPAAKKSLEDLRAGLRTGKGSSDRLAKEILNKPIVPSEMFISRTANIFPTAELRRRLTELQNSKELDLSNTVNLYFDPESHSGVSYDLSSDQPINTFPYDKDKSREGATVVYEFPKYNHDGVIPNDAYIIGCDPFKNDEATKYGSLAAIYVLKTNKNFASMGQSKIVASYIGRPFAGKNAVNEILHKLSLFYGNATIYFEDNVGNVKDYFEKVKRLDLLCRTPVTVFNKKASHDTKESMSYGYTLGNDKVKWEAIQYVRTWLLETVSDTEERTVRNIDLIPDPALLQELLIFDMKTNTDRVMSLVGCIIGIEEIYNKARSSNPAQEDQMMKDIKRLLVNNKQLFYGKPIPQTESFFLR